MKMLQQFFVVLVLSLLSSTHCSPFDDGKYRPRVYEEYDDGKYYRPLDEGKYIPGDEGRYTYIYKHGNWPFDGTYMHRVGSNPEDADDPYMGYRVYASRYPYIQGVIKGLVSKYVSSDNVNFGEATEGSTNHYSKVYADKEVAVKCTYLKPESNGTEFTTQYPPQPNLKKGEKTGSFYSFKGTKVLSTVSNALTNKLKLEYEVFVRIVEDVSAPTTPTNNVATTQKSDETLSPLIILRPPKSPKAESTTNNHVKNSINEIVNSLIIDDVLPTVGGIQSSTDKDLRSTIDDVQLLPNDDVKPTVGYTENEKDVKPSVSEITTLTQDDVRPTTYSSRNLNDDDIRPSISDMTTIIYDDIKPTNDITTVTYKDVTSALKDASTLDDVMPTSTDITTVSYDNVRVTTDEVQYDKANVTTSEIQTTTESGKR